MAITDMLRGRQVVLYLTNKSGGSVAAGDVVIIDTGNDTAFTTTTTGQAEVSVGIVQDTIANNAAGRVLISGHAALINVPSSMTRGRFIETHTVAKQATGSATRRAGSFGQFATGGTTPTGWIWGSTDQTASAGAGLTQAYVGYNTIGGSTGTWGQFLHIAKQVTLANACLITSVGAYVKQTTVGSIDSLRVGVLTDNAGAPDILMGVGSTGSGVQGIFLEQTNGVAGAAQWFEVPLGLWVPAGTYWLVVMQGAAATYNFYYDGSGSDRTYTSGGDYLSSVTTRWAVTTTSNKYSIRANTIR